MFGFFKENFPYIVPDNEEKFKDLAAKKLIFDKMARKVKNSPVAKILILLAAGEGKRFCGDKIMADLSGKPLFLHALETFLTSDLIDRAYIVVHDRNVKKIKKLVPATVTVVSGGKTRFESSYLGFSAAAPQKDDLLIFHNAANPSVSFEEIASCLVAAKKAGAAGVGTPLANTLRRTEGGVIEREGAFLMETPQVVRAEIFARGAKLFLVEGGEPTDDLMVAEKAGVKPKIIAAHPRNKKITFREDLAETRTTLAMAFYRLPQTNTGIWRVGLGHDSHRFDDKGQCVLGGLIFMETPRLMANSDGDAVLHALTNAVLSTIGGGSLSAFADEMCRGGIINSRAYLAAALAKLHAAGGKIENVALSIEGARPRLEKRLKEMSSVLAALIGLPIEQVGISATTGEGLTAFGRGEGVQVFATILASFAK